jgi:hypothetical protein
MLAFLGLVDTLEMIYEMRKVIAHQCKVHNKSFGSLAVFNVTITSFLKL